MGSAGGKARKEKLSPEQRKSIASAASRARWDRVKAEKTDTPPVDQAGAVAAPEPVAVVPAKKPRRTVPKEFGKAHNYAEKRLAMALKERAEAMQRVAMLNVEIPSLVQVIRALGGTVHPQALVGPAQVFTDGAQVAMPQSMAEPLPIPPDGIDPALYRTNSVPIPGISAPPVPLVPNTAVGGAMDLDYVPTEEQQRQAKDGWR
jgi:hypothetical protein